MGTDDRAARDQGTRLGTIVGNHPWGAARRRGTSVGRRAVRRPRHLCREEVVLRGGRRLAVAVRGAVAVDDDCGWGDRRARSIRSTWLVVVVVLVRSAL